MYHGTMTWFREYILPILLIISLGVFIYSFNITNKLFWDDDDWIINNPMVHELSWSSLRALFSENALAGIGSVSNYYRPVLFTTFAINYALGGDNPIGYHLVNNFFHIANGLLVFFILNSVLKKPEEKFSLIAFLTSLVFIIHPLQTEAVTYVAGRGDPMGVFFMLTALALWYRAECLYLSWMHWWRIGSMISLILALLTRETAIIFPVLLGVFFVAFMTRERFFRSLLLGIQKTIPYLSVVVLYGILRLTVLNFSNTLNFYETANVYSEHLIVRLYTFMHVLGVYLRLLVWPTGLHMERSVPVHLSIFDIHVWPMTLFLIGLGVLLIILYRKEKNSLEVFKSQFRVWFFGMGWFFVALGPVSGITPINALLYEHWLYLPMIGFFLIVFDSLERLIHRLRVPDLQRKIGYTFGLIVVGMNIFFITQSIKRNMLWGDAITFYKDVLKYEPRNVKINNNIGNLYNQKGDTDQAMIHYQQAIAIGDVFPQPYYNLGTILEERGEVAKAADLYEQAIKLDPNFYYAYARLAKAYTNQKNYRGALGVLEAVKQRYPEDPALYYNAALLQAVLGENTAAMANLQEGLPYATSKEFQDQFLKLLQQLQP